MPQQRWYGSFWLNGETDGDNCGAEPANYPDAETRAKTAHARVDSSGRCSLSDPPMDEVSHRPMIKQRHRKATRRPQRLAASGHFDSNFGPPRSVTS
jgi:hypothetical protein